MSGGSGSWDRGGDRAAVDRRRYVVLSVARTASTLATGSMARRDWPNTLVGRASEVAELMRTLEAV